MDCSTVNDDAAFDVVEAARRLGVSTDTVYREVQDGVLPHTRVRRRITITPSQLEQYRLRVATVSVAPIPLTQLVRRGRQSRG